MAYLISFSFKSKGIFPLHQDKLKVKEKISYKINCTKKIAVFYRSVYHLYLSMNQLNFMQIRYMIFGLLFLTGNSINAQFNKGDRMIGAAIGSVYINSGSSVVSFPSFNGYDTKSSGFGLRIEPTMGWFLSEKTAVGASININPTSNKVSYLSGGTTFQQDKSNRFDIGVGAFARNYFSANNTFMPYGQFGFNFGISSLNTEGFLFTGSGPTADKESYDGKGSGGFFANAALQLGMTKMLSESTGLDIFAGYSYSYNKNTMKTTTQIDNGNNGSIDLTAVSEPTTKFTNHGFIVGVGFQIFLSAKKK